MKTLKQVLIVVAVIITASQSALAQAPPPSGSPPSSFVGAPIDEFAWVPVLLMALYGIYTLATKNLKPSLKKA